MALLFARVTTYLLSFTANLLTGCPNILALPRSMALFSTKVGTTFQLSSADLATANFQKPARLVLQCLLSTQASFLREERTLGASFVVTMAAVRYFGMTTLPWATAVESAGRWGSSTRQRGLKYGLTTVTADFFKYSFSTASAWSPVTKLWTGVTSTLQFPPTRASTYVLGFETLVYDARSS